MKKTEFDQMMKNSFADRVVNIPSKTDNQIIAEFMGYPNIANDLDKRDYLEDCVKYHTSWDWLMPVIAKIVKNYGDGWIFEEDYDIKVRYKAVVKFIKSI